MNEDTRPLYNDGNQNPYYGQQPINSHRPPRPQQKKSSAGPAIAAGAGGFVVGAAAGAGTAMAANSAGDDNLYDHSGVSEQATDALINNTNIINTGGAQYTASSGQSFADAFAAARRQLGPGGVFEWHGKLYGTYYESEWNNMSNADRQAYWARVSGMSAGHNSDLNYAHNTSHDVHYYHDTVYVGQPDVHVHNHNYMPENNPEIHIHNEPGGDNPYDYYNQPGELHAQQPVNNEVHVIGTDTVQNENGDIMNLAVLESGGEHALVVDLDNSGYMDILAYDENHNDNFEDHEIHDISDQNISFHDLQQAEAADHGDYLNTASDDMPDYINDADSVMSI